MGQGRTRLRARRNARAAAAPRPRRDAPLSAALEADAVAKRYRDTVALAGVSLRVERGEVFGFLGPNGAGKSTAVKIFLGLVRADGGRATIFGAPAGSLAARRQIGYLPELFRYQEWLTGADVCDLHAKLAGIAPRDRRPEIARVLERVGLRARARDRVGTYSKGMQQRLGLAVALLGRPALVVLDEPSSALDPIGRRDVRDLVAELRADGTTVFLNSHLLGEVERICDRVAIVNQGRIVAEGTAASLARAARGVRMRTATGWTEYDVAEDAIPALVAERAAAGDAIYEVQPVRATLEETFFALVERPS